MPESELRDLIAAILDDRDCEDSGGEPLRVFAANDSDALVVTVEHPEWTAHYRVTVEPIR